MKIYREFTLESFEAWSGAVDTKNTIIDAGKENEFDSLVEEIFPDGASETEVNDFLWFDSDNIYEMLGISGEDDGVED